MNGGLTRVQSICLGLVVCVCLGLAGWGLFRIGTRKASLGDSFELLVRLSDTQDIEPGASVWIRGIDAGIVSGIEVPEEDPDHVQLRIKISAVHRNRIYADARAQINSKGLLGGSQLRINPGTSASGPLQSQIIPGDNSVDLQTVATKLAKIADQADILLAQVQQGQGTVGKLLKDDDLYKDLKSIGKQAQELLANANQGIGSIREELDGMKEFIRNGNDAIQSIKQDADAVKGLPIIRSYVEDPVGTLVRPQAERQREVYREEYLFEPGKAVLTPEGRTRLQAAARWLNVNKSSSNEVVIAAFADPKNRELTQAGARKLTEKQAEAVGDYLKELGVARLSWFSSRKVVTLGMGQGGSPLVEKDALPPARIEVILFTQR
ncbi:MCE family protein [Telmatocola sphagniphila]|uniref:MCE family protein n=1 Tax=Telmatocola sphagniphila TaxID=1123043 RepID=A0A8E6B3E8_9BACT|nr:MlaD family protein [Telmatocola sphagniphila]QVL30594.1 MCE family protein [Telmatocola sphagniphila]